MKTKMKATAQQRVDAVAERVAALKLPSSVRVLVEEAACAVAAAAAENPLVEEEMNSVPEDFRKAVAARAKADEIWFTAMALMGQGQTSSAMPLFRKAAKAFASVRAMFEAMGPEFGYMVQELQIREMACTKRVTEGE